MTASGRVHIVGAGIAGLAAAVRLSGDARPVVLYEATEHAGGRCRSFFDSELGCRIDNGNHLLLAGNSAALAETPEERDMLGQGDNRARMRGKDDGKAGNE